MIIPFEMYDIDTSQPRVSGESQFSISQSCMGTSILKLGSWLVLSLAAMSNRRQFSLSDAGVHADQFSSAHYRPKFAQTLGKSTCHCQAIQLRLAFVLWIHLTVFNILREVVITPNSAWGGEGSLGCGIGYGYLHRIPVKGEGERSHHENVCSKVSSLSHYYECC